jgi:hypothetical protein
MYQIYFLDISNNIKILGFARNIDESIKKLNESIKNFIIENEGIKKLDIMFITEETKKEDIKDGYYLIKENSNIIKLIKKSSNIITVNGWLSTQQNLQHNINIVGYYKIDEFNDNLLNEFITQDTLPIKREIKKDNTKPNNNFNKIIEELKMKQKEKKLINI